MKEELKHTRQRLADVVPLPSPFVVYIDPCGRCNFKCRFCPTNNSSYNAEKRLTTMGMELFGKIVVDLSQFKTRVKVINLFGFGEPLLNPHLPDMVSMLKTRNLCREVRITTNGSLLTPDLNKKLVESGVDIIKISVEALSADGYQDICGVSLDYNAFLGNLKDLYLCSRGTNTKISAKIISSTLLSKEDIDKFKFIYSPISDYYFVEAEEEYWAEYSINNQQQPLSDIMLKLSRTYLNIRNCACSFPLTDMMIFANGQVGTCCADWRMDTAVGDVSLQSLQEIWTGRPLYEFRSKHLLGRRHELPSCNVCLRRSSDSIDMDAKAILNNL